MVLKKLMNGMRIGVTVPSEEIDEPKNQLINQVALSLIVIMAIAILLTIHLSKMVVRPLKQLTEVAGKISEGDLSVTIECKTKDEVGVLAESFKRTVKHLKQYIDYINHLAYTDALTNTQNKTAYTDRTNRLDLEIKEGSAAFAVIVLDLNNLKKMNDTYGHEYGDMLIVDAAAIIQKSFGRFSVYRIGGDEFSVILTDEDYENYQELLKNFREEIVRFNAGNKRYQTELQIACGAAVYIKEVDMNFGDVFRRGDKEMYENKTMLKQQAKEAEQIVTKGN
jgi:diguanylate cyclase (GGDEF)-like protein